MRTISECSCRERKRKESRPNAVPAHHITELGLCSTAHEIETRRALFVLGRDAASQHLTCLGVAEGLGANSEVSHFDRILVARRNVQRVQFLVNETRQLEGAQIASLLGQCI